MELLTSGTRSKDKTTKKYKPTVSKFFVDQTNRILERYNEYFNIPKLAGTEFINSNDIDVIVDYIMPPIENEILTSTAKPMHTSAIQKSITNVNAATGATVASALTNAQVVADIAGLGNKITRVNIVTKSLIRDVINQSVAEGQNIFETANVIKDTGVNEYYKNRALTIARTETRLAYDAGGKIAYSALKVETFDIIGCVSVMPGTNDLGVSPGYGSQANDNSGCCGSLDVPMNLWDTASGLNHINHNGIMVASRIPL